MRVVKYLAVALAAFAATAAWGQEDQFGTERRAIARIVPAESVVAGARVGITDVENLGDPVISFGVFGDTALDNDFLLGGNIDYWEKSSGTLTQDRVNVNDVSLGVNAKYLFSQMVPPLKPYVLAGLSGHRIASKTTATVNNVTETETAITNEVGVDLGGGVMYRVQERVDVLGEARFRNILGGTAYDQVAFTGGISYLM